MRLPRRGGTGPDPEDEAWAAALLAPAAAQDPATRGAILEAILVESHRRRPRADDPEPASRPLLPLHVVTMAFEGAGIVTIADIEPIDPARARAAVQAALQAAAQPTHEH